MRESWKRSLLTQKVNLTLCLRQAENSGPRPLAVSSYAVEDSPPVNHPNMDFEHTYLAFIIRTRGINTPVCRHKREMTLDGIMAVVIIQKQKGIKKLLF